MNRAGYRVRACGLTFGLDQYQFFTQLDPVFYCFHLSNNVGLNVDRLLLNHTQSVTIVCDK